MKSKETLRALQPARAATAVALVIGLVACDGGNSNLFGTSRSIGGGTGTGGSGSYNLQLGIANMVADGFTVNVTLSGSVTINGVSTGLSGAGTYTFSPGISATFNNVTATSQTETLSATAFANGQSVPVSQSVTAYYTATTSEFLGQISSEYDVAEVPFQYPTSISGGSTGTLGTILRYKDSTMSVSLGSAQTTYVITGPSGQGGPIYIAITTKSYDTTNALVETDVTNYSMTTSNIISFVSSSSQSQQGTLSLSAG